MERRAAGGAVRGWAAGVVPRRSALTRRDRIRGPLGAALGIAVTALIGRRVGFGAEDLPWLVAPLGASAVLLFLVPSSPLAQPWSIVGGNTSAAIVGVAVARTVDEPVLAAALGVGLAIAVSASLGCAHPPAGAVALTVVLGPPAVREAGYSFALFPVLVNSLSLLAVALVVNNLSGLRYPRPRVDPDAAPVPRTVAATDLAEALVRDGGHDVDPVELSALVARAEALALDRHLAGLHVGDLVTTATRTLTPDDSAYRARVLINETGLKALPVLDTGGALVGLVTMTDLFNLDPGDLTPVRSLMTTDLVALSPDAPVSELVAQMVATGHRHLPVVADGRLCGLVGRVELITALHHELLRAGGGGGGGEGGTATAAG